jgi:hypothetical protein
MNEGWLRIKNKDISVSYGLSSSHWQGDGTPLHDVIHNKPVATGIANHSIFMIPLYVTCILCTGWRALGSLAHSSMENDVCQLGQRHALGSSHPQQASCASALMNPSTFELTAWLLCTMACARSTFTTPLD